MSTWCVWVTQINKVSGSLWVGTRSEDPQNRIVIFWTRSQWLTLNSKTKELYEVEQSPPTFIFTDYANHGQNIKIWAYDMWHMSRV